jgi:methyl-accepting chemotaxis protein
VLPRITEDARAITDSNLSARLAVPVSHDELQLLSETLNEMLERIERIVPAHEGTADASHELRAPMTLIARNEQRGTRPADRQADYRAAWGAPRFGASPDAAASSPCRCRSSWQTES